jgi:hypothetical protein
MPNIEQWNVFGQRQQDLIKSKLINYFGDLEEQPRWSKFDFIGEFINMEVKSRQGKNITSFNTTMMSCNKAVEEEGKELYFVFNFVYDIPNDKKQIYYIKYDKELFSTFEIQDVEYFDGSSKPHFFIPVNRLTKLYEDLPELPKCLLLKKKVNNMMVK